MIKKTVTAVLAAGVLATGGVLLTSTPTQAADHQSPAGGPTALTAGASPQYTAASYRPACVNQVGTIVYRPTPGHGTMTIPNVTLSQGNTGACVRYAQSLLSSHLGAPGPGFIDGIFGPTTRSYVRTFQGNVGITVDGVIGRNTWYWLQMIN
ncbi:peptidoglycan-binding protein [Streptomyces sp. NPDC051018]|uniref:peptidoglycan-binding protein n=1 Tax=Streptomyces sp. NPDC051018 TaxID=3365639 RepID=UPI0037A53F7D